jgi:hypothetical protein
VEEAADKGLEKIYKQVKEAETEQNKGLIVLSLFDGIGGGKSYNNNPLNIFLQLQ